MEPEQLEAMGKSQYVWDSSEGGIIEHQYLKDKGITPHGALLYKDLLVIPMVDESKNLVNIQLIRPDGTKRFLKGGKKKGCYHCIGKKSKNILICEGFATGASINEYTGEQVVVAFDAGNLKPVAEFLRSKQPDARIIIMADNDKSNTGQNKANEAAQAARCEVMVCPIQGWDFNDYITMGMFSNEEAEELKSVSL